ncbi:helix-turn-helix domain-containing protein [Desulfosporosinus nitroreducens]|uniref:Helix-turn-helix transcriptional regulator n=1 Tax=Desulfosporosinus nitroreducens TaxID=2018668 RepID=A0ABT8QX16_9FIRM|nr:helix-turn-helix transcriptional regulator [Desulfosporosinus nitroreducens]MCO1602069.1 helix-turn-helix transcriptional regulator [Desulfosporosinus nitroreducens]MDO0825700.1 helix-turn-helix transcriptional regulator [Desulfosporosinus nitroreducens]
MQNLNYFRTKQKLSQAELSRRSSVSQTYISELEANRKQPTYPILKKLAAALGVSIAELIGEQSPEQREENDV